MGVRGLTNFIETNPHLTMPYKLHDCTVVIDGNNLFHFLYSFYKIDSIFGGDYITYASKVCDYFSSFKKCNIKPIVVLDGGNDKSDHFLPTKIARWKERLFRVEEVSETGRSEEPLLPINAGGVFKNMLSKLNIPFVQCEYESDNHIAALANNLNCPVLSDDGDFYIFDVENGYIRISSLGDCKVHTTEDSQTNYLRCKIYLLNTFLSFYPSINKSTMPLVASLAGNDYVKYDDLKPLSRYIYPHPGQNKIEQILNYLSENHVTIAEILSFVHTEKQEEFNEKLDFSLNSYEIKVSNLYSLINTDNTLSGTKIISKSKLITPCGMPLPKEYVYKHRQGYLPSLFINVINLHRLFLRAQVGDLVDRSSYNCSCFVRRVIYGILFQHEVSTVNMSDHKSLCLRDVDEYDVDRGFEVLFRTKPLYILPSGKRVPQLHEINQMDQTMRLEFLTEVMGIKPHDLKGLPEKLKFLFGMISYWLQSCSPKPSKEFILALLLCIAHFNTLHEKVLPSDSTFQDKINFDLCKLHSLLSDGIVSSTLNPSAIILPTLNSQNRYDIHIIHSYNQLQTCVKYLNSLNKLLESPLKSPKLGEIFQGSVLFSLTKILQLHQVATSMEFHIELLLGKATECQKNFYMLLKKVLQVIPPGYCWKKTPNWNKGKSKFYSDLGFSS